MRLIFRHLRLLPSHTWDTRDVLGHTRGLFGRAGVVSLALVAGVAALAIGMTVYVAAQGWPLGHEMSASPDHVLGLDSNKASNGSSVPVREDKSRPAAGRHSGARHHGSRSAVAPTPGGQPATKPDRGSGGGGAPNRTGEQTTHNPSPGAKAGSTDQTAVPTPAVVAPEGNGKGHAYGHGKAKGGGGDAKSGGSAKGAAGVSAGSEKKSEPPGQAKKSAK